MSNNNNDTPNVIPFKKPVLVSAGNGSSVKYETNKGSTIEHGYKRYHVYHRYEDMEVDYFEVDGFLGVMPNFIAIAKADSDIQFVLPMDALKYIEIVSLANNSPIGLETDEAS